MITSIKEWKRLNENILVPRNLEGRKDKLRQDIIKLLSQEIIENDIDINSSFEGIPLELIKVKEINGDVSLDLSINNIPEWLKDVKIYGDFYCSYEKLSSLKNCPQYVRSNFHCVYNKLETLEGCPKYIGGHLYCYGNTNLLFLPKNVKLDGHLYNDINNYGEVNTIYENILSENILVPRNIEGRKDKLRQYNIELLSQDVIEGDLNIDKSFEGIPLELIKVKEIKGVVKLSINKGYIPEWLKNVKIQGSFVCSNNNLTTLENCPQYVGLHFKCTNNRLTSLEGCPKYIGGDLDCWYNNKILQLPKDVELNHMIYNYINNDGYIVYIKENILVPRNLEGRKKKLKQDIIKLLSQEVIDDDLDIDETFLDIQDELVKVKEIKGDVYLYLEGIIPSWLKNIKIYGSFDCSYCNLTSLENCPQYVGKKFACIGNNLQSLNGCPKYIGGNIFFDKGLTLPKDVEINGKVI